MDPDPIDVALMLRETAAITAVLDDETAQQQVNKGKVMEIRFNQHEILQRDTFWKRDCVFFLARDGTAQFVTDLPLNTMLFVFDHRRLLYLWL